MNMTKIITTEITLPRQQETKNYNNHLKILIKNFLTKEPIIKWIDRTVAIKILFIEINCIKLKVTFINRIMM